MKPHRPGFLIQSSLAVGMPASEFVTWFAQELDAAVTNAFMLQAFPGCELSERHGQRLWFKIPRAHLSLGEMFARIESAKAAINVSECVQGATQHTSFSCFRCCAFPSLFGSGCLTSPLVFAQVFSLANIP